MDELKTLGVGILVGGLLVALGVGLAQLPWWAFLIVVGVPWCWFLGHVFRPLLRRTPRK